MKNIDIAIEYFQKIKAGATCEELNKKLLLDGKSFEGITALPYFDVTSGNYTWVPEEVTITIPKPISKIPKYGDKYFFRCDEEPCGWIWDLWSSDEWHLQRFERGIWATEEEMKQVIGADKAAVRGE